MGFQQVDLDRFQPWQRSTQEHPWDTGTVAQGVFPTPGVKPGIEEEIDAYLHPRGASLDDVLGALRELIGYEQAKIPKGVVFEGTIILNSPTPQLVLFDQPLFSLTINNQGPNSIDVNVPYNNTQQAVRLLNGDALVLDFPVALLNGITLRLVGTPAITTIQLIGQY